MALFGTDVSVIISLFVVGAATLLWLRVSRPDTNGPSADIDRCLPTVLVVDDDAVPTQMMKRTLEREGFTVLTACNGVRALDLIRHSDSIKVVLLDYQMPTLDGAETLGFIRKYYQDVKVIGVTHLELPAIPESYNQGVDLLLEKPIKSSELLRAVCSLSGVPMKSPTPACG